MKKFLLKFLAVLLVTSGFQVGSAYASDLVYAERDCAEILEQWANDPDSVPQHLVDECKEAMAAGVMAAGVPIIAPSAGGQRADPCAGPGATGSAHCWGPWSTLAPAAAGVAPPDDLIPVDEYDLRPELAEQFDPVVNLCNPGTACGFATIVDGTSGQAPAADTTLAQFDLAGDGSQFTVAPGETGEIASVGGMTPAFIDRPDGYENMQSVGMDGTQVSQMIARVIRDNDGNIIAAADVWANGDLADLTANSGYFAWGVSMSQADVNALNSSAVSAVFAGPMSVDNTTVGLITLNFGTNPTWSGGWTNPGYSFDAGGALIGVDLVSDPAQFSNNVGADSYVQGALLGDSAGKSIAHIIDVDVAGIGRIKDVGLLRE